MKNNLSAKAGKICKKFSGAVKALVATAMIALAGTALGYSQTINGVTWYYDFIPDSSDVSIAKGESQAAVVGATGEVTVPSKLGGYTVRRIGQYAFYNCSAITKVTIPSTVEYIGLHAFDGCSGLTRMDVPSGVTEIDRYAFRKCTGMMYLTLPTSLTTIGAGAFYGCSSLLTATIPSGVTTLNANTFYGCAKLKTVTLPYGLTTLNSAFSGCTGLQTVFIPIKFINTDLSSIFSGCPATLEKRFCGTTRTTTHTWHYQVIKLPGGNYYTELRHIYGDPAVSPTANQTIQTPATVNGYPVNGIGYNAFKNTGIKKLTFGSNVTSIGDFAFYNCGLENELVIPNSVTNIGMTAFCGCAKLPKITLSTSLKAIKGATFQGCKALEEIAIPDSVTNIAAGAFKDCSKLNWVTIRKAMLGKVLDAQVYPGCASDLLIMYMDGSSVDMTKHVLAQIKNGVAWYFKVYNAADLNAVQLVSPGTTAAKPTGVVSIPSTFSYQGDTMTLKSIGADALMSSTITEVTIPNTVTNIGARAFDRCANLTKATISSGVKNIEYYAFGYCTSLSSVTIPSSVEVIGGYAFAECSSLSSLTLNSGVKRIESWAFHKTAIASVYVPDSVEQLAENAFTKCTNLKTASLPSSLYGVIDESKVFASCPSDLKIVYRGLTHKVTFNASANGGSLPSADRTKDVAHGAAVGSMPTPNPPSGYSFTGWFTAASGGTRVTTAYIVNAAVTFYAHYTQNPCTVTFNANGGTVSPTTRLVVKGGQVGTLPTPTRDGYTCNGWWTSPTMGGQRISETQTINGDVTFYANWLENHTVTFNANGGTPATTTRVVVHGSAVGELPEPTRAGDFTFGGWWTAASGGSRISESQTITANATYYVHWTENFLSETVDGYKWYYTIEGDGSVRVFKAWGSPAVEPVPTGVVTIPATLGGKPVTIIGGDAFINCSGMTKVLIPDSVTTIWASAFKGCSGLKDFMFPDGLSTIMSSAFQGCTGLEGVEMPVAVSEIGNYAFALCSNLKTVTFAGNCPTTGGDKIYDGANSELVSIVSATASGWAAALAAGTWQSRAIRSTARNVTVTFDPNGGEVAEGSRTVQSGSEIGSLPTPTRTGNWFFQGWFTEVSGGTKIGTATAVSDDVTYYAHWAQTPPTTTTVTFNPNGGTVSPTSKTFPVNTQIGELPTPVWSGYRFDGWWMAEEGGTRVTESTSFRNSTTIYAHWKQSFTVTFNAAGGTPASTTRTVASGAAVGDLPTPERADWTFLGWFTAASGGSEIGASTTVSGNVTYYAHWKKTNFTVTFDANGGTVSPATRTVANGAAVGALPTPAWAGNSFQGWFTAASGGTQVSASTTVDSDVTYYAHWKSDSATVTVTFDANGGTVTPASKSVATGSAVGDLPTPAWEDHVFQGWFTAGSGGTKVDASTVVSANATFYAQWLASGYSTWTDANGLTWIYRIDDGKAELYNDDKAAISPATVAGSITVPVTLGGCPVTRIGDCAFLECPNLERVTIPSGVTSIGDWCFQDSPSLKGVSIPAGVTDLGDQAFSGCKALEGISLPASVTTIGSAVFSDCPALAQVNIPAALLIIPECAFADCIALTSMTLPSGVATIADSAFVNCANLSSMRIPKTVTSIGIDAFTGSALAVVYVEAGDTARVKGLVEGSGYDQPVTYIEDSVDARTVTFDPNGGTVFETYRRVESGEAVGTLPAPEWAGHTFDGWFTAVNGGTQISESTTVSDDVTYYAHWTEESVDPDPVDPGPVTPDPVNPDPVNPDVPCYVSLDAGAIVEPYSAPKAVKLRGAAYSGCDVVGIVELKLGKVNAKKQKSKVSGSFIGLDGKKCTIKAMTVTGVDGTAPVTVSLVVKKVGTMTVSIGGERFAGSLGAWHVQSADVGGNWTQSGSTVSVGIDGLSAFAGTVLADLLPNDVPVTAAGGKWKFAKAAGVKWAKPKKGAALPEIYDAASGKGLLVNVSKGSNLSAMKLAYTPKKGTFKGSFKVYALDGAGKATKLKKYTVKVSGVVADGVGYGQAMCKRPAVTWAVLVK